MEAVYSESPNPTTPRGVRNTFLTVICVLTFIGSGWGLVGAVRSYFVADYTAQAVNGAMQQAQDRIDQKDIEEPNFVKRIMGSVEEDMNPAFLREIAIFKFISCLLTLAGAIIMFNLKKFGFYLYILGIIVLVISPLVAGGHFIGAIGASITGFIGVVFIVMYGVNLKQMRG